MNFELLLLDVDRTLTQEAFDKIKEEIRRKEVENFFRENKITTNLSELWNRYDGNMKKALEETTMDKRIVEKYLEEVWVKTAKRAMDLFKGEPIPTELVSLLYSISRKVEIRIVTNSGRGYVTQILENCGLKDVITQIISCEIAEKPSEKVYSISCGGYDKNRVLFIDDNKSYVKAARNFGIGGYRVENCFETCEVIKNVCCCKY